MTGDYVRSTTQACGQSERSAPADRNQELERVLDRVRLDKPRFSHEGCQARHFLIVNFERYVDTDAVRERVINLEAQQLPRLSMSARPAFG